MPDEVIIAVDLGGTRLRAARLDKQLNILERHETLTKAEEGRDATLQRVKDLIYEVLPEDDTPVAGIGISAPGPLNPETGVVVAPPNLPGWHDVPLKDILQDEFGCTVYVGNDANVAALAEVSVGAAKGYRHVIYLTVSTGIGSGLIYDGRLLLGQSGLAAEAGHMTMLVDGERVSTLEKEAAGPALARQAQAHIRAGEASIMREMVDGDLDKIDGAVVGEAAQKGDDLALRIVKRSGRMVGLGIVTLLHLLNPEIIVIGGGVTNVGDLLFEPMREAIEAHVLDDDYWKHTKIIRSDISEDVSIYGSATLVLTDGGKKDLTQVMESLGIT
jgi:glucokinase